METLKLNTIYPAFMGECNKWGIGVPCTFVRLSGCNLRCYEKMLGSACDTPEALSMAQGNSWDIPSIIREVKKYPYDVVCLTGGEPLLQDVTDLIEALFEEGLKVAIETNGTQPIKQYIDLRKKGDITFIVDVKAISTGESNKMLEENYPLMQRGDFAKFVIYDQNDYDQFVRWLSEHSDFKGCIGVGTYWGGLVSYATLLKQLQRDNICVYLNMQAHKMMCMYDAHKQDVQEIFIPKNL